MKKVIPQIIILIITLFISSCGSDNKKTNQPSNTTTIENKQSQTAENTSTIKLSLDDFNGIPEEVMGCSCYFSETDQKFKNEKYLFAAGFDSIGFVSVSNKLVKLNLISTGREPHTFGDYDHIKIYSSDLYKVTVDIKYKGSNGYETWWNEGTVTIENKDGQKVTKKFIGECGC